MKVWPDEYYIDDCYEEDIDDEIDEIIERGRDEFRREYQRYEEDANEFYGIRHEFSIKGTRLA